MSPTRAALGTFASRAVAAAALCAVGCHRPGSSSSPAATTSASDGGVARAARGDANVPAVPAGPTGTVEGTIFLDGEIRPGPALTVPPGFASNPGCADAARRYAQPFDITAPGPFPGALAAAEAHESSPAPVRDRVFTFRDCDINPRVLFATTRDRILFHADTQQRHLPHIIGGGSVIDQVLLPGQPDQVKPIPGAGRYPVTLRSAPNWVHATLIVMPNRFIDQADAQGHFRITDVPVGDVLVHAWYPGTTEARQVVAVRAGQTAHVDFHVQQAPEPTAPPPARDAGPVPP